MDVVRPACGWLVALCCLASACGGESLPGVGDVASPDVSGRADGGSADVAPAADGGGAGDAVAGDAAGLEDAAAADARELGDAARADALEPEDADLPALDAGSVEDAAAGDALALDARPAPGDGGVLDVDGGAAGDAADLDAAALDAGALDAETPDAGALDAETPDAGALDAADLDAADLDAADLDAGALDAADLDAADLDAADLDAADLDAGALDAADLDAADLDAEVLDAADLDAEAPDAAAPDAADLDAEAPDAEGTGDAGPSEDASGAPDAGLPDVGPAPLVRGTATVQSATGCAPSPVPTSSCLSVRVSGCDGVADMTAYLKVTSPQGPPIGTVLLGSGGGGGGWYEAFGPNVVNQLIQPLVALGFQVVQRAWQPSWLAGPGGARRLACRGATLLDAIHQHLQAPGTPLCATGNSGGSAELAYALAHYGAGELLDLAILTSGPPLARIDYGCLGPGQVAGWDTTRCGALAVAPGTFCAYGGETASVDESYGPGATGCTARDPALEATFAADSVLTPDAALVYPETDVRFVYGGADSSSAVPIGRLYAEALGGGATTLIVPSAPHALPQSVDGAAAVYQALVAGCVLRH